MSRSFSHVGVSLFDTIWHNFIGAISRSRIHALLCITSSKLQFHSNPIVIAQRHRRQCRVVSLHYCLDFMHENMHKTLSQFVVLPFSRRWLLSTDRATTENFSCGWRLLMISTKIAFSRTNGERRGKER